MAKLLKLRRGTTSQHSSFTGAEGEVTIDTTKDTAVVHDGSTAGGQPLLREDLDNMPASGVSAGTYGSSSAIPAITVNAEGLVTGATTSAIDSTAITNGTSSASVAANGDITVNRSGNNRLIVDNHGAQVAGRLDVSTNISVAGTVDGRDVAADGTKLDGIESGATADQTAAELLAAIKTVDGNGSGLDADRLQSVDAAFLRNASNLNSGTISVDRLPTLNTVPSGAILIWSGAANALPSGYVLCDGSNSTPNLRDRFVVGAGTSYSVGDTGGSENLTLSTSHLPGHTHSTGNHSHSVNSHAHSIGSHSHNVGSHSHSTPNHSHSVNSHSHTTPNHNHNMNNHSHSTSNTGSHSHSTLFRSEENNYSNAISGMHPARHRVSNSSGNYGTNSAGNHSHNTNSSKSNTNSSGGGNTGSAGANTANSGASNTGNSSPNTSTQDLGNTGNATANTTSVSAGTTGSTGSGSAFDIRPPFYALCYIMKT